MAEEYAEQLFLQEKPTLALLAISSFKKTYASVITKEISSTFAHTTKILSKMKEHELVEFTVEGRVKYVELTEHGIKVVDALKNLIIALGGESRQINSSLSMPSDKQSPAPAEPNASSRNIQEKIDQLQSKIETIYSAASESGADKDALSRKLGPFNRDITIIENLIESSEDQVDESVVSSLNDVRARIESLIGQ